MIIFRNTLKRIFRNKIQVFFIILFPLAFMSLGFIGGEPVVKTAIIDKDHTDLTASLIKNMGTKSVMKSIEEDDIESQLTSLKVDYVVVIEKGFTDNVIQGKEDGLTTYSVKESNFSKPVSAFLEQWVRHTQSLAKAVNNQEDAFYREYKQYDQGDVLSLEKALVIDPGAARTRSVLGYLIISMLYTSLIVGLYILLNKNNHTFYRTLAAPVRIRNYMLQTVSSFLVVSLIQIAFVMGMLKWVYNMYMGDAFLDIFLLLLIFSLVTVSFGVAISSVSKSIVQACLIGICLVAPMAMLGGAYFPLEWAPDIIKTISQFTPVSWVLTGIEQLLQGETIFSLGKEILIILLFALIFFLVGTVRKVDIAK